MLPRKPLGLPLVLAAVACNALPVYDDGLPNQDVARDNRLSIYLGQRQLDDDDFSPVEEQGLFGLEFAHEPLGAPVGFEFGLMGSADSADVPLVGGGTVGVEVRTSEIYAGVKKSVASGPARPYIGGGVSSIVFDVEVDSADFDDSSLALYIHGGFAFDITPAFSLGVDVRLLRGSDLSIQGIEFDGDYEQIALVLGFAF